MSGLRRAAAKFIKRIPEPEKMLRVEGGRVLTYWRSAHLHPAALKWRRLVRLHCRLHNRWVDRR